MGNYAMVAQNNQFQQFAFKHGKLTAPQVLMVWKN